MPPSPEIFFFSETESFKYRKSEKTKTSIYFSTCIIQTTDFLIGPLQTTACKSPQTLRNLSTATYQIKVKFYTSEKHRFTYKHRTINQCLLLSIIRTTYPALLTSTLVGTCTLPLCLTHDRKTGTYFKTG